MTGRLLSTVPASASLTMPGLWLTGVERWAMLVGLSLALGGLAGRGLARQYLAREDTPDAPAPLPAPWALRGSLLGAAASAALVVTALAGPGVAASLARPPAPGLGTRATGVIAAVELACFALAAILLRLRQSGWSVLPLVGVVVAEAVRAHPEGVLPVAGAGLTCCHLLPAVMWAGMLVYTARTAIAWRAYPQPARDLMRVYGTAAAWLFAILVVTGLFSALLLVPFGSLLTTTYGRFLIAKAALVAVVAALAVAGRARLRRPAKPGTGLALATKLEIAVLAAVLAVTGLLTVLTPPAKPVFPSAAPRAAQPARYPATGDGPVVLWTGRRGEDGMSSDPPPDDVRLAGYAFFPVAEGRPAVVVPGHLEHTRMSSHTLDTQARPERPFRRRQVRHEGLKHYLAEQGLLL